MNFLQKNSLASNEKLSPAHLPYSSSSSIRSSSYQNKIHWWWVNFCLLKILQFLVIIACASLRALILYYQRCFILFPVEVVLIACVILVGLFALQHYGTHKVAFVFAPVVIIWLAAIFSIGLYNIIYWNPKIFHAISPHYLIKFFIKTGKEGWISLGGMLLCITGMSALNLPEVIL